MNRTITNRPYRFTPPAGHIAPACSLTAVIGVVGGCLALAIATWLGSLARADLSESSPVLQLGDMHSERLYRVDPVSGIVHVFNLHGGVAEIASLRETAAHVPRALRLEEAGRVLIVETGDARLFYDTRSFRLVRTEAAQALAARDLNSVR